MIGGAMDDRGLWIAGTWGAALLLWLGFRLFYDGLRRPLRPREIETFLAGLGEPMDATGNDTDNLSLSDRRAESAAELLTQQFGVPAENLTSQGYGEQYLKVPSDGPERRNRRVTVRNITPLLNGGEANAAPR